MFFELLASTFIVAVLTSTIGVLLFYKPIKKVLGRLVSEELASVWQRYVLFAIYAVGISGGIRVWELDRYITPDMNGSILQLDEDRWVFEIYKTIIGSLQSIAWLLFVFFLFALIAYVVVRGFELKKSLEKSENGETKNLTK